MLYRYLVALCVVLQLLSSLAMQLNFHVLLSADSMPHFTPHSHCARYRTT
jgi:hypothetical protein